jgi:hypothetical protein
LPGAPGAPVAAYTFEFTTVAAPTICIAMLAPPAAGSVAPTTLKPWNKTLPELFPTDTAGTPELGPKISD